MSNKIALATESCPLDPPKWTADYERAGAQRSCLTIANLLAGKLRPSCHSRFAGRWIADLYFIDSSVTEHYSDMWPLQSRSRFRQVITTLVNVVYKVEFDACSFESTRNTDNITGLQIDGATNLRANVLQKRRRVP